MRIDHYEFGRIVIDGEEQRRDLILTSEGVHPNWWRGEGHVLSLTDLDAVLDAEPDVLVVGTGAQGRMRPEEGLEEALREQGIRMEALPTGDAVRRVHELVDLGDVDWSAALHLTC